MPERDRLLVLGAGGHGKVVAEVAAATGWSDILLFDDAVAKGTRVADWVVHGVLASALEPVDDRPTEAIVAIGDNALRLQWLGRLEQAGVRVATVTAPSAIVSPRARIGPGTVIVAGAIVAIDARIGRACIINTGCTIDHDCVIGDGAHISPGARLGGKVRVGARVWVGIGASVRHEIMIADDAIVGAGAAVVSDVGAGTTVVGVPARPLRAGASEPLPTSATRPA